MRLSSLGNKITIMARTAKCFICKMYKTGKMFYRQNVQDRQNDAKSAAGIGRAFVIGLGRTCLTPRLRGYQSPLPWQFLYFLPEPQGQGSLRPILGAALTGITG